MPLPDSLYYNAKALKKLYTSQPTGKLDVNRALEKNPKCWRKVDLDSKKLPKTIVINEFSIFELRDGHDLVKIHQYEDTIARLLREGFEVYLWLEDGPIAITHDNIDVLRIKFYQDKLKATPPKEIIKQLAQHQIPVEAIQLVNGCDLRQLTLAVNNMPHDYHPNQEVDVASIREDNIQELLKAYPMASYVSYKSPYLERHNARGKAILEQAKGPDFMVSERAYQSMNPLLMSGHDRDNQSEIREAYEEDVNDGPMLTMSKPGIYWLPSTYDEAKMLDYTKLPSGVDWYETLNLCGWDEVKIGDLCAVLPKFRPLREIQLSASYLQLPDGDMLREQLASGVLAPLSSIDTLKLEYAYFKDAKGEPLDSADTGDKLSKIFGSLQHVFFDVDDQMDPIECFRHVATNRQLRSVSIENHTIQPTNKLKLSDFLNMPLLKTFHWSGTPTEAGLALEIEDDLIEGQDFVLEHLTELKLPNNVPIKGLQQLLQRAPNLKILSCCWHDQYQSFDKHAPALEALDIHFLKGQSINGFYNGLKNKDNLKHLSIETDKDVDGSQVLLGVSQLSKHAALESFKFTGTDVCLPLSEAFTYLNTEQLKKLELTQSDNSLLEVFKSYPDLNLDFLRIESYQALDFNDFNNLLNMHQLMEKFSLEAIWLVHLTDEDNFIQRNASRITIDYIKQGLAGVYGYQPTRRQPRKEPTKLKKHSKMHLGGSKARHGVDANTGQVNDLDAVKIFKGLNVPDPDVSEYRLSFFNEVKLTSDPVAPFELTFNGNEACHVISDYVYGQEAVDSISGDNFTSPVMKGAVNVMISDEWTMLPSLQAHEKLINLYVEGYERDEIEIGYNVDKHMYAVRKKTPGSIATLCHMNLHCPTPRQAQPNATIDGLVQFFNEFECKALDLRGLPAEPTGDDLLKAIIGQKRGVCRHRAIAFLYQAAQTIPDVEVNIITNDVHAFVELVIDGQSYQYDLGGAPSNIKLHEPQVIVSKTQKEQSALAPPGSKAAKTPADKDFELDKRHTTWKQDKSESAKAVCLEAISQVEINSETGEHDGRNVLIQCKDDSTAHLTALQLQYDAVHTGRPVFVIDSPDLVKCASKRMQRLSDGSGKPVEGGGPLYDFLTQDFKEDDKPVLIIEWHLLNPEDVVRLNSLIDEQRSADGTDIPRRMVVVGVYNTKSPDAYKGSDFYSRNEIKYTLPVEHDLDAAMFELEVPEIDNQKHDLVTIEVYDSDDWKEILLGQWVIDQGKVAFKQGPLLNALEAGKGVHLANAPWTNPDFKRFWQQLKISGEIEAYDHTYPIPENFWGSLRQSKGYDWTAFDNVVFVETASDLNKPLVLGGATLAEFMQHTRVENHKPQLAQSKFSAYAGEQIDLVVMESLHWQVWHQLLCEAKRHQVKLNLAVPEGVDLPEAFNDFATVKRLRQPLTPKVNVVHSTDPDFTVLKLRQDNETKPTIVIDISDMETENVYFDSMLDIEKLTIETTFSDVWGLINSGQDVILKGTFTPEVAQHLQTLALEQNLHVNGNLIPFKGKLTLVSEACLSPAIAAQEAAPTVGEKIQWLLANNKDVWGESLVKAIQSHPWPQAISVEQIQASIAYYQRSTPPSFDYLAPIEKEIKIKLAPDLLSDPEQLQRRHMEVVNKRFQDIDTILATAPYVFIAGPTGVGKSTFVDTYLTKELGYAVHHGLSQLKQWANDKTAGLTKVIFIDEANISSENYRMFEGLYEDPPFITIEGEIIELDDKHKVVFAGNPMSYGGERNLPSLIARHGNICTFEPLPPATIQLEMLQPILEETITDASLRQRVSQAILKTYVEICQYSQTEVLISPRELKMMAMMTSASEHPGEEYEAMIYKLAMQALPEKYHTRFKLWADESLPAHAAQPDVQLKSPENSSFILTESRKPIYQSLGQLLSVRDKLVLNPNSKVAASGLGGMLLEGEPGTGKSLFYLDALRDYGYRQVSLDKMKTDDTKAFVFIPASMDFEQKAEKLIEAFEQGLIVVTDEINSGPALEQLLNSLLMGQHPDKSKDMSTIKPGFQLLGTQNPISMGHRQATSAAIARRVMKFEFDAYTKEEMAEILQLRLPLLDKKTIKHHINLHFDHRQYAQAHDKEPIPVFRDLYKLMENKNRAKQCKMPETRPAKHGKVGVFNARDRDQALQRQVQPKSSAKPTAQDLVLPAVKKRRT